MQKVRAYKRFARLLPPTTGYAVALGFAALVSVTVSLSSGDAFASTQCDVQVDCSTHEITVLGETSRIDCGKPGHVTRNGVGRIGGYHHGRIVPNGIEIEGIPGMGASGGGKVLHSVSWGPRGLNQSNGCIHVLPQVRDVLHQCQGSRISITGANSGYQEPRSYRRTHRHRRHHRRHRRSRYYEQQESESYQ